jgi:hypothetical protein
MPVTDLFPTEANLAAAAWHLQRLTLLSLGNGIDSGFAITRNSLTSVTVAAGIAISSLARVSIAQAVLDSIPEADTDKHRYDMVVVDLGDGTTKRIEGTQATPSGRSGRTPADDFLENYLPLPPPLSALTIIPLYCLRITDEGLEDVTFGDYAVNGIAPIKIGSPLGKFIPNTNTSTSTAAEQTIAHGLGVVPSKVEVYPTGTKANFNVAFGTHTSTNLKMTVTPTSRPYRWYAWP